MDIKIIVATHKAYKMPQDKMYIPIHVGRNGNAPADTDVIKYIGDNTGENISDKNKNYCELTGLYWAWKNLNFEYLGLAHYRRHFKGKNCKDSRSKIITYPQLATLLKEYDVILPKKRHYLIESSYSQYIHAHNKQDLDKTFDIIKQNYPEYVAAWNKVMKSGSGHRFNMFIMKKDILNRYLEWLFDILFKLEKELDISNYSKNDQRVYGFVAERLLDVWFLKNNINYVELSVVNTESQHWHKKIFNFLKRKFIGMIRG